MARGMQRQWKTGDTCKFNDGCSKTLRLPTDPKHLGTHVGEGLIGMCSVHHRKYVKDNNLDGVKIKIDWSQTHHCVSCSRELCRRTTKMDDRGDRVPLGRALGGGYECRACHDEQKRRDEGCQPMNRALVSEDGLSQRCNKCEEWFTYESGSFRLNTGGRYRTDCRGCEKKHNEQWREENRDGIALRQIKWRYGIDYEKMLELQNSCCAICIRHVDENRRERFDVDHDHSCCSGTTSCGECVRGLLCVRCNLLLGQCEDNVDLIAELFGGSMWGDNAILYLTKAKMSSIPIESVLVKL